MSDFFADSDFSSLRQSDIVQLLEKTQKECQGVDSRRWDNIEPTIEQISRLLDHTRDINGQQLANIDEKLRRAESEARTLRRDASILKSLTFERMSVRYSTISERHSKTFHWIFEPSRWPSSDPRSQLRFKNWLSDGDGIYWVSGKPGSGKSTLMKYLYDCEDTKVLLQLWAQGARLVTAGFFFWIAGTNMQKSQHGLLQQLLFEILKTVPEWISTVCAERCQLEHQSTWTLPEIRKAFTNLEIVTSNAKTPTKLCMFIDGLDEYNGDHLDLIQIVEDIALLKNLKLCVSSRPWNCFEDAFGQNSRTKLYLQDLTRDDIAAYATDKLNELPNSCLWRADDFQFQRLISEVVLRAQGVFLWVILVARSLRDGLGNGDSPSLLFERLLEIPSDLEEFFEQLIRSVDKVYRRRMAHTFQMALAAHKPLRLVLYSFIEKEEPFSAYAISSISGSLPAKGQKVLMLEDDMNRQLNGRYKGLLESAGTPGTKEVEFLHRTVRDFLVTESMQTLFKSYSGPNFNASARICEAFILQAKNLPSSLISVQLDDFLVFAQKAEESSRGLDRILTNMNDVFYSASSKIQNRLDEHNGRPNSLIGKAIESGLVSYVRFRLDKDPSILIRNGSQALLLAVRGWMSPEALSGYPGHHYSRRNVCTDEEKSPVVSHLLSSGDSKIVDSSYKMMALLLSRGADANSFLEGKSLYNILLDSYLLYEPDLRNNDDDNALVHVRYMVESYLRLLILLLQYTTRVDLEVPVSTDHPGPWKSCLTYHPGAWGSCLFGEPLDGGWLSQQAAGLALELLSSLFGKGLQPSTKLGGRTCWAAFIDEMMGFGISHGIGQHSLEMYKLFLRNGADPHLLFQSCDHEGVDRMLSMSEVLDLVFEPGTPHNEEAHGALRVAIERTYEGSARVPGRSRKRRREEVCIEHSRSTDDSYKKRSYEMPRPGSRKRHRHQEPSQ